MIDTGGLRVETTFTKRRHARRRAGRARPAPAGPEEAARRRGDGRRQDRGAARLLRRPGLPAEPAGLGQPGRLAGLGVQAVRAGRRSQGRLQPQEHLRRQLALPVRQRRRHRSSTRAPARATATARRSACSTPPSSRSTRRTPTSPTSIPDGPAKILDMAVRLGVPRKSPGLEPNRAIALGSATISPITMANAYATIANGGVHHDWFVIKKVTRASDGKVLYRAPNATDRALPSRHLRRRQLRAAAGRQGRHRPQRAWPWVALPRARPAPPPTPTTTSPPRGSSATPRRSPPR